MITLKELLNNNLIVMGSAVIVLYFAYKILNRKDKSLQNLEVEYNDLVTSEKYKVKGQF